MGVRWAQHYGTLLGHCDPKCIFVPNTSFFSFTHHATATTQADTQLLPRPSPAPTTTKVHTEQMLTKGRQKEYFGVLQILTGTEKIPKKSIHRTGTWRTGVVTEICAFTRFCNSNGVQG